MLECHGPAPTITSSPEMAHFEEIEESSALETGVASHLGALGHMVTARSEAAADLALTKRDYEVSDGRVR